MEFIEGFVWPVPLAFASAVSACRFEQGDVLYSARSAYEEWSRAAGQVEHSLQVLDPPRSSRLPSGESEGKRFFASWTSPVQLVLAGPGRTSRTIATTQGRLFACLWRGDVSLLEPGTEEPSPPRLARELQRQLDEALPAFRRRLAGPDGALFLSVLDRASDASRIKAEASLQVLRERYVVDLCDLGPEQAGVSDAASLHPSLALRGLAVRGASEEQVEQALKGLLYTPSQGSEQRADRFSLSRHGLLSALAVG